MLDLLTQLGLPVFTIVVVAGLSVILWRYLNHRLEKQQQQFASDLILIQSIHRDRFSSVDTIHHYLTELCHHLHNLDSTDKLSREQSARSFAKDLRIIVREKSMILGEDVRRSVYALTDYSSKVLDGNSPFDPMEWLKYEHRVLTDCRAVLSSIPHVSKTLRRTK